MSKLKECPTCCMPHVPGAPPSPSSHLNCQLPVASGQLLLLLLGGDSRATLRWHINSHVMPDNCTRQWRTKAAEGRWIEGNWLEGNLLIYAEPSRAATTKPKPKLSRQARVRARLVALTDGRVLWVVAGAVVVVVVAVDSGCTRPAAKQLNTSTRQL